MKPEKENKSINAPSKNPFPILGNFPFSTAVIVASLAVYFVTSSLYKESWVIEEKVKDCIFWKKERVLKETGEVTMVVEQVKGLQVAAQDISVGSSSGSKPVSKDSVVNLDHGDPTMFESFWRTMGEQGTIVIPGWQRMSYFSDVTNVCWFLEPDFAHEIRRLHKLVGNAAAEDRHIVVGTGSTQLFQAALYALSPSDATMPISVVSAVPYYSESWVIEEKVKDCIFWKKERVLKETGEVTMVVEQVKGLQVAAQDISVGSSSGSKPVSKDSVVNLDHGDPTMFESFWRTMGEQGTIVIPGWQRMSYFSDVTNVCWFLEPDFAHEIRRLHKLVGNAAAEDRHIVVGTGSTQLFQAALYALSPSDATMPISVVSAVPYYSSYPAVTDYLRSGLFQWAGDASTFTGDSYIEIICSPNNPDGFIKHPVLNSRNGKMVHDLAYYWPYVVHSFKEHWPCWDSARMGNCEGP
ncbi:uncharacterized protein A4U43_C01F26740 [Asparagus officinalis]|uniref:Alliinase C-terminal domain-containing protein n=1 Tax=Asparagus officinalis TaxID=4686 RepID=A0A5P1FSD2_ASPOF|nr:uncharacterized protein A4U43_C01F26740 [Asparagus officinalis]